MGLALRKIGMGVWVGNWKTLTGGSGKGKMGIEGCGTSSVDYFYIFFYLNPHPSSHSSDSFYICFVFSFFLILFFHIYVIFSFLKNTVFL